MKKIVLDFLRHNWAMLGLLAVIFFVTRKIYRMEIPITKTNFADITLGVAAAKNVDMQHLVLWYIFFAVVLCTLFAYLFHKLGYYAKLKAQIEAHEWRENDNYFLGVLVLGQVLLVGWHYLSLTYVLTIVIAMVYIHKTNSKADKKEIFSVWASVIWIFSIPCIYIGEYLDYAIVFFLFSITSMLYLCHASREENFSVQMNVKLFPYLLAAIVSYIMLAGMEIMLARGNDVIAACVLLPFAVALAYSLLGCLSAQLDYKRLNFYGTLGLMVFSYLPFMGMHFPIDFFEGSNHGLSIEEFILGMGIPFFHNLDAHMLSGTLPGLIYYYLTGDYTGALFEPYRAMIVAALGITSLVYLFKHYFTDQEILIMLMLFPWSQLYYHYMVFILFALFLYWKKKQGVGQGLLLMVAFMASSLYRIDLGSSFGLAVIICPILYCLAHRKYDVLGKYVLTGLIFGLCSGLFAYLTARYYDLDIIVILQSFLTAFSSNQHWGLADLGDPYRVYWSYFLLPLAVSVMLWPYVQRLMRGKESTHDWIALFLYSTFVFNIPRILARHTMVEKQMSACDLILVLTGILLISGLKKNRAAVFSFVFLVGAFLVLGFKNTSIEEESIANVSNVVRSVSVNEHCMIRIGPDDMKRITAYREFFDANLTEDETYFDFTNMSLFYAFIHRRNPVYVNQCPAMINGYKGQKQAIASLVRSRPKFVTAPYRLREKHELYYGMDFSMDDILNSDRYYLLTDYIVKNYRPYCAVGNYAIWCLKSDYESLCRRDMEQGIMREYLDYTYEPEAAHKHYLGAIPSLWGKCDIANTSIQALTPDENQCYRLTDANILGQRGFITLDIETSHNEDIVCQIVGDGTSAIDYSFRVEKGLHRYRLLVSSDILWYSGKLEKFVITNNDVQVNGIRFEVMPEDI